VLQWLPSGGVTLGVISALAGWVLPSAQGVDWVRRRRFGARAVLTLDLEALSGRREGADVLFRLADVIETAGRDPLLAVIHLRVFDTRGGFGSLQCLRAAIKRARESGRAVVAELVSAGNADLYVASACDRVFCTPAVESNAWGVHARLTYFGDALRSVGVGVDVVAIGDYKSLAEPATRSHPSQPAREAVQAVISDLHGQWVEGLAASRGLSHELVEEMTRAGPLSGDELTERGLVDAVAYSDEVEAWLEQELGGEVRWFGLKSYQRWRRWRAMRRRSQTAGARIAVVHCSGPIMMSAAGRSGALIAASDLVALVDQLREQDTVRGVVLAVTSGGGSALASELIARAIERLGAEKPVVSVLGDMAASGGYYFPVLAHEIYAQPGTLTGSIGVVGGKLLSGPALAKLGVHVSTISGASGGDPFDPSRPFTPDERQRIERSMSRFYDRFLERVASGRGRTREGVEPWAGGRVWTGRQARDLGMIDGFGTTADAFRRACALADLEPWPERRVDCMLYRRPFWQRLARKTSLETAPAWEMLSAMPLWRAGVALKASVGAELALLTERPGRPLALLPWRLDID